MIWKNKKNVIKKHVKLELYPSFNHSYQPTNLVSYRGPYVLTFIDSSIVDRLCI